MSYVRGVDGLIKDLQNAGEYSDRSIEQVLDSMASMLADTMRREAPVRTGELMASINVQASPGYRRIGPNVPYADYVEFGTEPHEIRPKNAKVLAFQLNGQTVFARVVRHPGTEPNPFVARSLEMWEQEFVKRVADAGVEAVMRSA